mmetsp:Transcript_2700/g.7375  ORF Transcript_2700/g.7375 Transcript_2700/m.7375 type:complete len:234 (+) Transcript_2700:900-1601(+)
MRESQWYNLERCISQRLMESSIVCLSRIYAVVRRSSKGAQSKHPCVMSLIAKFSHDIRSHYDCASAMPDERQERTPAQVARSRASLSNTRSRAQASRSALYAERRLPPAARAQLLRCARAACNTPRGTSVHRLTLRRQACHVRKAAAHGKSARKADNAIGCRHRCAQGSPCAPEILPRRTSLPGLLSLTRRMLLRKEEAVPMLHSAAAPARETLEQVLPACAIPLQNFLRQSL